MPDTDTDTTTAAPATPAPSEATAPPANAPSKQEMPDPLGALILEQLPKKLDDLQAHTQRLTALADSEDPADAQKLQAEIGRTVMAFIGENVEDLIEFGTAMLQFRNWALFGHEQHATLLDEHSDRLEDHSERVNALEVMLGGDSQLSPEDAQLFSTVAIAAQSFAEESLKVTSDPNGRLELEKILMVAKAAQERIDEIEVEIDEDDEEEDDDVTPPAAAAAASN